MWYWERNGGAKRNQHKTGKGDKGNHHRKGKYTKEMYNTGNNKEKECIIVVKSNQWKIQEPRHWTQRKTTPEKFTYAFQNEIGEQRGTKGKTGKGNNGEGPQ